MLLDCTCIVWHRMMWLACFLDKSAVHRSVCARRDKHRGGRDNRSMRSALVGFIMVSKSERVPKSKPCNVDPIL